ncbi:MAG: thermonuclease family protein [Anaerolineales bacterium]|nr:thermonuclease family protein [Anaerolineales bacterium]
MKSFVAFWKKDVVNKLIVVALFALAGGTLAFGLMLLNMPQGKSLADAFSNFIPVAPTSDVTAVPTANIGAFTTSTSAPNALPTATAVLLPIVDVPTFAPVLELTSTPALEASAEPPASPTQSAPSGATCVPTHPVQTGKVVEILDGNTVRVLIDKLVYVVRYTGVEAPKDKKYADAAKNENSKLVYGKEVTLVTDVSDKDSRGRLLRYVMQGNLFVNQKLIEQGLGSALDVPPDSACAAALNQAQQTASSASLGMWSANKAATAVP